MELNEKELENVLGGANKEVINNKVMDNKELYRDNRVAEIEKEIEELKEKKEEILEKPKTM